MEDARFTRFIEDDGSVNYFGMYTAFDGSHLNQYLLETTNFQTFDVTKLIGHAARNKGMALFPRRINGEFAALSRWDNENISVARSTDIKKWDASVELPIPRQPWEFVKLGNCGPPIETPDGWLVLTHGVGAMREYSIGAVLLDLNDPSKMIGSLNEPLMSPTEEERDGYSPNVLYSCGALLHEDRLLFPYGCSDDSVRIALIDLPELMIRLRASR
ncbi:beta-1,4-mannooligosaccharide phosphorylase [mine drainage metagenome]|uniref:Beta-1,4-mannooligosaccharide phosphorylase n=1 Tax=mine drainage metagenome TaxID=410659 RepID=A0A1J5QLB9_9ZZZZ